ncbi:MAG: agmatine deiminase family protein [Chromatiales bacterium]|nr:agmatine deiminase family protein [Chromatiales bacterium]
MSRLSAQGLPDLASRGYRMPSEWSPHQATWLSWPHNLETWPGCLAEAERAMADAVAALATGETVRINVRDADHGYQVEKLLGGRVPPERVRLHLFPTNDAWIRDHGAIFVTRPGNGGAPLVALDFRYNAWGGKYPPWDLDDGIPARMAEALGVPFESLDVVLEGGSIEVNGAGMLLTTEQCLLNPNRNPQLDRGQIEVLLRATLGVHTIGWLGDGIVGDDTDGHVDDLTRFVSEDTVVTVVEPDPLDENHAALADNLERLRALALPDGRPLRIVELPMPEPCHGTDGRRLPASYANFYIGNRVVLMPTFACPADEEAAAILARCFPGRRVVGVDSRALVSGLGSFHCLTQQVPAAG